MADATLPGYAYAHLRVAPGPAPGTALVELARAARLNAFVPAMWRDLGRLFRRLGADAAVRAVVLAGDGDRAFCAGLDVRAAADDWPRRAAAGRGDPARVAKAWRAYIGEFQECVSEIERCEKPVICVMHGIAYGLAVDIACCADVRICAADTRFSVKEVDIGLAADVGTLARLPRIVGSASWVKDVCLSARDFSAAEAQAAGFVSQVHADKAAALRAGLALAAALAAKSPVAVQGTKELLNHGRDHATADSLRYTAVWNSVALQAADVPAAMLSGLDKEKKTRPTFEKL